MIASLAGSGGPSATFQWNLGSVPSGGAYRVIGYIYVYDTGTSPAWVNLYSYSNTANT